MKKFELTDKEAEILEEFLEELSERFSNDSCNDYELEKTKENVKFLEKVIRNQFCEEDAIEDIKYLHEGLDDNYELMTQDILILGYLRDKMFGNKND